MLSPDAPSRENPMYRSWLHWLVVNVPGMDVANGQLISEYFGPIPPSGSGLCRYVVLVYEQSDKLDFEEKKIDLKNAEDHSNFDVEKFAQKYDMKDPLAGNVFQAKWDEFVKELMKVMYEVDEWVVWSCWITYLYMIFSLVLLLFGVGLLNNQGK